MAEPSLEQFLPWALLTPERSLSVGGCPGHCGLLSNIPSLTHSMPGAPSVMTDTDVPRHPQCSLRAELKALWNSFIRRKSAAKRGLFRQIFWN